VLGGVAQVDPSALAVLAASRVRRITRDPNRRIITREEFVAAHHTSTARPPGHGFPVDGRPYYRYDIGRLSLLVLDTVDEYGGWQGSLDLEQFAWLQDELARADAEQRYAVLASHHSLDDLVNDATGGGRRVLAEEFATAVSDHPSLVLWLNGHTHATAATPRGTWWELTAPSLIDWPQQARVVEILQGAGTLTIAATMLDHAGDLPWAGSTGDPLALAGLSRELAGNDWQWRRQPLEEHPRAGRRIDRNVLLPMRDPWA
jgi:hypothetical protein